MKSANTHAPDTAQRQLGAVESVTAIVASRNLEAVTALTLLATTRAAVCAVADIGATAIATREVAAQVTAEFALRAAA